MNELPCSCSLIFPTLFQHTHLVGLSYHESSHFPLNPIVNHNRRHHSAKSGVSGDIPIQKGHASGNLFLQW